MDFLEKAKRICSGMRSLCDIILDTTTDRDRDARLQDLGRRFEFLTASAEIVGCIRIARMANAIQALLLGMADKPGRITSSSLHTTAAAIDFITHLVQNAGAEPESPLAAPEVIAVDDDQLSNRLVVSSLRAVQIKARSECDPLAALRLLASKYYNLVLLDVEMPQMDGVDFCRRLRLLPGYETTPVIFVTLHSDPDTRSRAIESGGDDLIAKPISPLELAVKVLMHLLKRES
jgi:CheY-like chemotaxis protein